jgi:tetratricopeptide (TPR) repeat protein
MSISQNINKRIKSSFFIFILISIPFLFFLLLEGGLRLAGIGDDLKLFVNDEVNDKYLYMNERVSHRYFSNVDNATMGQYDVFLKNKEKNCFRIFVQGGSTAAGFPYNHGGSFSRILQERLQKTFPDKKIEVINTAMAAVNSYTLLDFASEIVRQQPDLILIYAGHNEYYGVLGVGASESIGNNRILIKLTLKLKRLRLFQLMKRFLVKKPTLSQSDSGERVTLMAKMVKEQEIPFESAIYMQGVEQFNANLDELLELYKKNNIPVFIGTLVSNYKDQVPLLSQKKDEEIGESFYDNDIEVFERALLTKEKYNAEEYYRIGRVYLDNQDYKKAKQYFSLAKDHDLLKFRAPEIFNDIITYNAQKHNAIIVDVKSAMEAHVQGGIIGNEHMLEHLHPNIEGYFLMADAFYESLKENNLIGNWSDNYVSAKEFRSLIPVTEVDSIYGELLVKRLTSTWPFKVEKGLHDIVLEGFKPSTIPEVIAFERYKEKMKWPDALDKLYQFYMSQNDYKKAALTAKVLAQEYPHIQEPSILAGKAYYMQSNLDDAVLYFEKAYTINPSLETVQTLAMLHLKRFAYEAAEKYLKLSIQMQSSNNPNTSILLKATQSIPYNIKKLKEKPEDIPTLLELGSAYLIVENFEEAEKYLNLSLQKDPENETGKKLISNLIKIKGGIQ